MLKRGVQEFIRLSLKLVIQTNWLEPRLKKIKGKKNHLSLYSVCVNTIQYSCQSKENGGRDQTAHLIVIPLAVNSTARKSFIKNLDREQWLPEYIEGSKYKEVFPGSEGISCGDGRVLYLDFSRSYMNLYPDKIAQNYTHKNESTLKKW